MSAFVCIKGYKEFCAKFREKYGYPKDSVTGAISIMDSSWDISFILYDKYFANQAEDEDFLWFDGLYGERVGDYIKKPHGRLHRRRGHAGIPVSLGNAGSV